MAHVGSSAVDSEVTRILPLILSFFLVITLTFTLTLTSQARMASVMARSHDVHEDGEIGEP